MTAIVRPADTGRPTLLLLHGRWALQRNQELVLYSFYKNFTYCLAFV
jgi:magnesium-transporting ATPase (P-type)